MESATIPFATPGRKLSERSTAAIIEALGVLPASGDDLRTSQECGYRYDEARLSFIQPHASN